MKKLLLTVCICLSSSGIAGECKSVTLAGPNHHPPYSERKEGKMEGIAFDQADFWFEKIGAKVNRIAGSHRPEDDIQRISRKEIDGLVMGATDGDLEDQFTFSEAWHKDGFNVFYHKDHPLKFFSLTFLKDKLGVYDYGRNMGADFERMKQYFLELKQIGDRESWIVGLRAHNFDYLLLPYYEGINFIKEKNLLKEILYADKSLFTVPLHFMISKKNPCAAKLDEIKNEMIQALKQKTVQKIIEDKLFPKVDKAKTADSGSKTSGH